MWIILQPNTYFRHMYMYPVLIFRTYTCVILCFNVWESKDSLYWYNISIRDRGDARRISWYQLNLWLLMLLTLYEFGNARIDCNILQCIQKLIFHELNYVYGWLIHHTHIDCIWVCLEINTEMQFIVSYKYITWCRYSLAPLFPNHVYRAWRWY